MYYEPVNEERRLWKYILFGILTLGIYDLIFMWNLCKDLNRVCGPVENDNDSKSPNFLVVVLLGVITFSIYYFFWYYKQGNRMNRAAREYGFEIDERGSTYLLWIIAGVLLLGFGPIIAFYLFIGNVNKLSRAYNRRQEIQVHDPYPSGPNISGPNIYREPPKVYVPPTPPPVQQQNIPNGVPAGPVVVDPDHTMTFKMGTIEGISGSCRGMNIPIYPGEVFQIGRDPSTCQIIVQERDISRTHCKIEYREEGLFVVTDLSTYNTTYLNGTIRLDKGVPRNCPFGSKLTLGKGSVQFMLR